MMVTSCVDTSCHQREGEKRSGSTRVLAVCIAAVDMMLRWLMWNSGSGL